MTPTAPAREQAPHHFEASSGPCQPAVWPIRAGMRQLNHGSYGVTPAFVRQKQAALQDTMNADPATWFLEHAERIGDSSRALIAGLIGCDPHDLTFVRNATIGTAVVLQSIDFAPGDTILLTDHEYQATFNELHRVCARTGAVSRVLPLAMPVPDSDAIVDAFVRAMDDRTRLVIVSHITSASASVMPIERIIAEAHRRGIAVLIDGAHGPGQVAVDLRALRPTYYVANGHKWLCGPKGSGFLYADPSAQAGLEPLAMSARTHAGSANGRRAFLRDFDYVGTDDMTPCLALGDAIEHIGHQLPGGWGAVRAHNHALVAAGGAIVAERVGLRMLTPKEAFGSMLSFELPADPAPGRPARFHDPLFDALLDRHGIQVPVWRFMGTAGAARRVLRISAHLHNTTEDYALLAAALVEELAAEAAFARP